MDFKINKKDFEKLLRKSHAHTKKNKLTKKDLQEAIKKAKDLNNTMCTT